MPFEHLTYDPFALTTGLPDDFDGVVTDAWFGYDTKYMSGQSPLLILLIESGQLEEPARSLYGIGEGWEIDVQPKGRKLTRPVGLPVFSNSSGTGSLIKAFHTNGGIDALRQRGFEPTDVRCWIGLNAHWNRVEETRTFKGETTTGLRLVPTKFYGYVDTEGAEGSEAPTPSPTPSPTPAPKTGGVVPKATGGGKGIITSNNTVTGNSAANGAVVLSRQQRGKLLAFATESEYVDVEAFIEAARQSGQFADVSDDTLLAEAPGIYAQAG